MNILRTAILAAIFIKCVTASSGSTFQFREAVDEEDMDTAVQLQWRESIWGDSYERLNYVIEKKNREFIFDFAKQTEVNKGELLAALHRKKSPEMIEEAFKVFKFHQRDLIGAASNPELMCSPDNLFNLLGKITWQKDQEYAIDNGVVNLFRFNRTECLDPLLDALEGNESLKHLKDVAIKQAFRSGSSWGNESIVERFHDHPAVTSDVYAGGMIYSQRRSAHKPTFIFLLGEADQNDLNAVKKHRDYEDEDTTEEFKKAIDGALLTAKPGGTRSTLPIQRAELVMKTFKNDSSMGMPTVISEIIAFYVVDESIPKSRIRLVNSIKEAFGNGLMVEIPKVISELIAFHLVDELTLGLWDNSGEQSKALTSKRRTDKSKHRSLSTAFNDLGNMARNLQESENDDE